MTLAPGRFDYAPITERPVIKWPDNARLAFWVAPNMEFFEYLPENRPTQPDIPHYSGVLLPQSRDSGSFSGNQRRDGRQQLGLHGARSLQQPADLRLHRRAGAGVLAGLHYVCEGDDRQTPERTARRRRRIHCQDRRPNGRGWLPLSHIMDYR